MMIDHHTLLHPVLLEPLEYRRAPKIGNFLAIFLSLAMILAAVR